VHKPAQVPNDLERFFVERANAGDIDGLMALYESNATLDSGDGQVATGHEQIRKFLVKFLAGHPQLAPGIQAPALCSGDLALTSSRDANGDITAEIARRQPDGNWLWAVDQFSIGKIA
jgi:ketosteroid isomerase-like protein